MVFPGSPGILEEKLKITKMFSVLMCALTFSVSAAAFAQHERVTCQISGRLRSDRC